MQQLRQRLAALALFSAVLTAACGQPSTTAPRTTSAPPPAPSPSEPAPVRPADALALDCSGPFRRDMSVKELEAMFGAAAVTDGEQPGAEGTSTPATFVHAAEPGRKLVVIWRDAKARRGVESILVSDKSGWRGPSGLRIGSDLAAVAAANGKPVKLYGFSWDYGGTVSDWNGGAFDKGRPGCSVFVRFDSDSAGDALGDSEFASSDARMVAAKPKVAEWGINFITLDEEG